MTHEQEHYYPPDSAYQNIDLEKEQKRLDDIAWLAGMVEVGGSMYVGIQVRNTRTASDNAYPYVGINSRNVAIIEYLRQAFGGSDGEADPSEWKLGSYAAANLVIEMGDLLPSRQEQVLQMENWLNVNPEGGGPERVEIAQDQKGFNRLEHASIEGYADPVMNNAFVAGILDNRGTIHKRTDGSTSIEVQTTNLALLEALKLRFGGSIHLKKAAGSLITIGPDKGAEPYRTKNNSYVWNIAAAKARSVLEHTIRHQKIKPYEGWDRLVSVEKREMRAATTDTIKKHIRQEIQDMEVGARPKISTAAELGTQFGLSKQTTRRILASLPDDLRMQREKILRSTNRRVLTPKQVQECTKHILDEIAGFKEGLPTSFTGNQALAEMYGVGVHIIDHNIMPFIPPEDALLRQQAINSQKNRKVK